MIGPHHSKFRVIRSLDPPKSCLTHTIHVRIRIMNLTSMSLVVFLLCLPQTLPFRPRLTFRHPIRAKGSLNAVENDSTSPYQIQFQSKISALNSFSSYDLLNLKKPSHARLFLGARAASTEPLVIKAFSALYEDMSVLRLGGNMMFSYMMTRGEGTKLRGAQRRAQRRA